MILGLRVALTGLFPGVGKAGISSWPPAQPSVLLFANDFSLTERTNIQLRISHTEGKTWSTVLPISNGSMGVLDNGTAGIVAGYVDVVGYVTLCRSDSP